MSLPIDPRRSQDPIGAKSSQSRLLIDMLAEGIVFNLASATASNYNSDKYGSTHRILYESVAKITASLIVDALDLNDDSDFSQIRPEYLSSKILYLVFDEGEEPIFEGSDDLREKITKTLTALTRGSTLHSISTLLNEAVSARLRVDIEVVSAHSISAISRCFSSTQASEGHRHLVYATEEGIGSTSAKIGSYWGDDRHTHDIVDGVVQSALDENGVLHTHALTYGIDSDTLAEQENTRRLLSMSAPAHVSLKENSSLLEESVDSPSFSMDLSLGMSFQDDNRRARAGTVPSSFFVYADGTNVLRSHKFNNLRPSDTVIIKPSALSTEQVRRRVVEIRQGENIPDGEYRFRSIRQYYPTLFPFFTGEELWEANSTFNVVSGRVDPSYWNADLDFISVHRTGEPITAISVDTGAEYVVFLDYIQHHTKFFFNDPKAGIFDLVRREIVLDVPVEREGLVFLENLDSDHISSPVPYKEFSFPFSFFQTPTNLVSVSSDRNVLLPEDIRKMINGLPVIGTDFQVFVNGVDMNELGPDGTFLFINYFETTGFILREERVLNASLHNNPNPLLINNGDIITVRYPQGDLEEYHFHALNNPKCILNSVRPRALGLGQSNTGTVGEGFSRSVNPLVLYPPEDILPTRVLRREITTGLINTDVLNTGVLGTEFTLNSFDTDVNVPKKKVFAPATARAQVLNGKIDLADIGFTPRDLISIVDDDGNRYNGVLIGGYIVLNSPPENGTQVTVTAISTEPFSDEGDWFALDSRSEGQVPFTSDPITPYPTIPTADDIMANPQGRPLSMPAQDSARRVSGKVTESVEGTSGELKFFDDALTELTISGSPFDEENQVLTDGIQDDGYTQISPQSHQSSWFRESVYRAHFIAGGRNGDVVHQESVLNGKSILTTNERAPMQQVRISIF